MPLKIRAFFAAAQNNSIFKQIFVNIEDKQFKIEYKVIENTFAN